MDIGKDGGDTHPVLLFWPGMGYCSGPLRIILSVQARTVARDGYSHRLCLGPFLFRYVLNR